MREIRGSPGTKGISSPHQTPNLSQAFPDRRWDLSFHDEIFHQSFQNFDLILRRKSLHCHFEHPSYAGLIFRDKALIIDKREEAHDELAIHAVRDTAMTWDRFTKVFDFEGTFQAGGKETTEGSDQRGKCCEDEDVELHRSDVIGMRFREDGGRKGVRARDENGVRTAGEAGEDIRAKILGQLGESNTYLGATYVDGANEVLVAHQRVSKKISEEYRKYPGTHKPFHSLLWRKLDQLSASEQYSADVCPDVVGDDKDRGHEEPDHAFKNVIHNEVSRAGDHEEGHVCPGELSELKAVVPLFQGRNKKDETYLQLEAGSRLESWTYP